MGARGAEHSHHAVADVFVYGAAVIFNDAVDELKVAIEQIVGGLGAELAGETGKSAEIGEEHRDLALLAIHDARHFDRPVAFGAKPGDGAEETAPMSDRADADLAQVFAG